MIIRLISWQHLQKSRIHLKFLQVIKDKMKKIILNNKTRWTGMRRKEKLKMLILDGFKMRWTTCRGRFKIISMRIRIKNFSNRIITLCNRFQKYREIKIFKLQTKMKEESLFIQSKYKFIYLSVFQVHSRLRKSSSRSFTIWDSGASSCQENNTDGSKKADSIQSKEQLNSAIIEAISISKQTVSHA